MKSQQEAMAERRMYMMKNQHTGDPIDPRLLEALELIKQVPARDPGLAARTRSKFYMDLGSIVPEEGGADRLNLPIRLSIFLDWFRKFHYFYTVNKTAISMVFGIILIFSFLFGGASITARASRAALPGDALYSLKTSLEQARISISGDLIHQTKLYLEFADNRLHEISRLVESGRFKDALALTDEFDFFIDNAYEKANQLSVLDPQKAAKLKDGIQRKQSEYHQILGELMLKLPSKFHFYFSENYPFAGINPTIPIFNEVNDNANLNEQGYYSGNENTSEDLNEIQEDAGNFDENEVENGNGGYGENEEDGNSNEVIENEYDDSLESPGENGEEQDSEEVHETESNDNGDHEGSVSE